MIDSCMAGCSGNAVEVLAVLGHLSETAHQVDLGRSLSEAATMPPLRGSSSLIKPKGSPCVTPIPQFSHLDSAGNARMVDVSAKKVTRRVAVASCVVKMRAETVERLRQMPKGDAITVARLAGIQAAKRVDQLVPLAHTLNLDHVDVKVEPCAGGVRLESSVVVTARTGAEIEAMMACSNAALALYDMIKAVEKDAVITDLRLERKSGGRSGSYERDGSTSVQPETDGIATEESI